MKSWKLLLIGVVILVVSTATSAQRGVRRGAGYYDTATEVTLTGAVDEVRSVPASGRGGGGLHVIVSAQPRPIEVHIGPAAFVSSKKVAFTKGDVLTVIGSKVTISGQQVVLAREIKKGDQVLTLRDASGTPLWSRRGRDR